MSMSEDFDLYIATISLKITRYGDLIICFTEPSLIYLET